MTFNMWHPWIEIPNNSLAFKSNEILEVEVWKAFSFEFEAWITCGGLEDHFQKS